MTERRDEASATSKSSPEDGASLFASGGLVLAILAIVLLTAFLETEPRRPELPAEPEPAPAAAAVAEPPAEPLAEDHEAPILESPAATPPAPAEASADPRLASLASRVERDLARLGSATDRWTAQLIVARDPASVERLIAAAKGDARLYVLPVESAGEPRFRVCWGVYRTSKEAAAAADLPAALRSGGKPFAQPVAKVVAS